MGDSVSHFESPDSPTVLLRRLHRWRMAFFGLVILLAGMLSGVAVTLLVIGHIGRQASPPPLPVIQAMLARIGPRLRLSEEQTRQLEPILVEHKQRLDKLGEEGRAAIAAELKTLNDQMAVVLSEDQIRLWQQLLQELPGQIRHVPGGFGPGPGPGRGMGGGGRFGPGRGGQGPLHMSPEGSLPPDTNTASPH